MTILMAPASQAKTISDNGKIPINLYQPGMLFVIQGRMHGFRPGVTACRDCPC